MKASIYVYVSILYEYSYIAMLVEGGLSIIPGVMTRVIAVYLIEAIELGWLAIKAAYRALLS